MKLSSVLFFIFCVLCTNFFLCASEIFKPLEQAYIASVPYTKDIKPDWSVVDDIDYFNLFPNLNRKDTIGEVGIDNRTDYKLIFKKSSTRLYEKSNYTIRKTKGPDIFFVKPEDAVQMPVDIRDLNEPEIFLYDVYAVLKEGEKGYFLGKFLFGYSCNRIVLNAIIREDDTWSEEQKKEFDGLVLNCQDPQEGYIKAYVREHHKEFWTSWGAFFVDKGYKKIKFEDGTEVELRLWIYYGPDYPKKSLVMGIQKRRPAGTPCVKDGKAGKTLGDEACKVP